MLQMWDAESGEEKRTLRGHKARVIACVFSLDGKTVLSGSLDKTLKARAFLWSSYFVMKVMTCKAIETRFLCFRCGMLSREKSSAP